MESASKQAIGMKLGISDSTFAENHDFLECYEKARGEYLLALHKNQKDIAFESPNPLARCTMSIWLGKDGLGQRDTQEIKTKIEVTVSAYALQALQALAQLEAPGEPAIEGEVRVLPAPEIIQGNDKIT